MGCGAVGSVTLNSAAGMMRAENMRAEPAGVSVRVASYPDEGEPEVMEVSAAEPRAATAKLVRIVMDRVRAAGGKVPEEAVREVVENLVHAGYRGVVISIFAGGNVVRVSDKGPGIANKERAMEFGFSGAAPEVAAGIRGVGAGLGIARTAAEKAGGTVTLDDNIGGGTVATISSTGGAKTGGRGGAPAASSRPRYPGGVPRLNISERQQKVLITVLECGEVGPSNVAERLEISVSTAYRDLSVLEEHGLVVADEGGKRLISPLGRDLVEAIVGTWVK